MQRRSRSRASWILVAMAIAGLAVAVWLFSPHESPGVARSDSPTSARAPLTRTPMPGPRDATPTKERQSLPPPRSRSRSTSGPPWPTPIAGQPGYRRDNNKNRELRERNPVSVPIDTRQTAATASSEQAGFTDRAGFGADFAEALNRQLFPLASECIDLARSRNPELAGLLAVHVQVIPVEGNRALVAAVEPRNDNEINDPELFECVEQSSFSIDGLPRPLSFDITMPIEPGE